MVNSDGLPCHGSVYVMKHSFFEGVVRVGCTPKELEQYAAELTNNTNLPGKYSVYSYVTCDDPCLVRSRVLDILKEHRAGGEFFDMMPEEATAIIKRESMRIPALEIVETSW